MPDELGLMSLTMIVPASDPSLFQSSRPCVPSVPEKNRVSPTFVSLETPEPSGLMSLTMTVPASVPSLFHSSRPWVPSSAAKKRVPARP
jgi:hypothetical protein